ncbi:MAG TPA: hypothetical protein VGB63_17240 [Pedobacter sp.]|jgi:hypothetical protein
MRILFAGLFNFSGIYQRLTAIAKRKFKQLMYVFTHLVLVQCILSPYSLHAQETSDSRGRSALTIGYFGETISHPGLFAGYEHNLMPQSRYQILMTFNLGGYVHRRNHTGLISEVGLGQRLNFRSGLLLEQHIGIGYLHTLLNGGPVYEVKENGVINESGDRSRSHLMPSLSLGFGWNVARTDKFALLLFVRPKVFWQYPFNSYALPHVALQAVITKVIR